MAYVTIQGQAWDQIAEEVYGSEKHADFLMKSNPKLLNVFIFSSGTVLETPVLPEGRTGLPAWRSEDG